MSYQNQADRNRREQQYHEYLRLQSKLNERGEKAFGELARDTKMGIKSAPPRYKSSEEELQDEVAQRELAVQNLREIMPRDALAGLAYLPTINDLNLFNRSFPDFKAKTANQKFITPAFFGQLWEQYKDLLASTNYTGISIPLTQTGLEKALQRQRSVIIDRIDEAYDLSRQHRQAIVNFIDKAVRDGNADVINRLERAVFDGRVDVIATLLNQAEESRAQINEVKLRTMTIAQLKKLLKELVGIDPRPSRETDLELRRYLGDHVSAKDIKDQEFLINAILTVPSERDTRSDPTGSSAPSSPATGSSMSSGTRRNIEDALEAGYAGQDPSSPLYRPPGSSTVGSMEEARTPARSYRDALIGSPAGRSARSARTATSSQIRGIFGSGCTINPRKPVLLGMGLQPPPSDRYLSFGKYYIHMPSLKQSKLNIKYPSFARIPELPIVPISTPLKNFIRDLVENQRMNIKAYQALSESDRKLFNKVARRAKIDDYLGIDEDDEDRQEKEAMIDRFNILKGEIDAGNDAPQVKQEMKRILSRFITDGTISKSAGTQLLIELSL